MRRNDDSRCIVLTIVGGHALKGRGESRLWFRKDRWFSFSGKLLLADTSPPLPHSTQITAFTFHGFSFFPVNCFISLNFTGFDWLIERGYRPNCRNHCRQAEKAETTTCFSICERRSPVAVGAGNRELKMETFSGRRQLQPDVTSWFVQNCACSCSPHYRRAPVGDVKLVCLALWREREYLTLISIRFVAFSNQNFADYRP